MTDSNPDASWIFESGVLNEDSLKALCSRVETQLSLPNTRICRYFGSSADECLRCAMGSEYFRGAHIPFAARTILPHHVLSCFFHPLLGSRDVEFKDTIAFDHLIYIRSRTCENETGFITTYAHELQHVIQRVSTPRLLHVNQVLYQELKALKPDANETDIPSECEANIVSKRIAENIFGIDAVRAFAEEQIRFMHQVVEPDQEARWVFFRDVDSSMPYNFLEATLRLVNEYKDRLDFGLDINQPSWWIGPIPKQHKRRAGV
jgi:hypothetical protein